MGAAKSEPTLEKGWDQAEEIDLRRYVEVILRRWRVVLGAGLIFITVALLYSFLAPRVFRVETVLQVGSLGDQPIEPAKQVAEKILKDTYGPALREKFKLSQAQFPELLVKNPEKTDLVRVAVETDKTSQAQEILAELGRLVVAEHNEIFQKEQELLSSEIKQLEKEEALFTSALERQLRLSPVRLDQILVVDSLQARLADLSNRLFSLKQALARIAPTKIIKAPEVSAEPVRPKPVLNFVVALVLGLFFGIFLAFAQEWWEQGRPQAHS